VFFNDSLSVNTIIMLFQPAAEKACKQAQGLEAAASMGGHPTLFHRLRETLLLELNRSGHFQ
jgi:hypothetical protein